MTVDTGTRPTQTWTRRVTVQLTVLAAVRGVDVAGVRSRRRAGSDDRGVDGSWMIALTCVTATRGLFDVPQATGRK